METVEKKSIAGQQTAIQTDFSTRNAFGSYHSLSFCRKIIG